MEENQTTEREQIVEVRAIFFDLWGTLIYNAPDPIDYAGIADQLGVSRKTLFERWRSYNLASLNGQLTSSEDRATRVLSDLNLSLDNVPLLAQMEVAGRAKNVNFYPGVPEMLDTLHERGFKTGLISNSNYLTPGIVRELKLDQKLDVLVLSYEVGHVKPEPTIYQVALQRMGFSSAHECLYVGDGSDNEMVGANEAGFQTAIVEQERGYAYRNQGDYGTNLRLATVTDVVDHVKLLIDDVARS